MIIRKLLCLIFSLFIILSAGCSSDYDSEEDCPTPNVIPGQKTEAYYDVMADENLSDDYKSAIFSAIDEWAVKTNQTLRYKLSFVDMTMYPPTYTSHTIKIYVRDPGPGYVGWTSWLASEHAAYVFVRPSIDGETFRIVMLHELGHAFDLDFDGENHYQGPYASVMYPSIGQSSKHLCCPELRAFCDQNGCQVDCEYRESGELSPTDVKWLETEAQSSSISKPSSSNNSGNIK